jgi:hypothetical protein
LKKKTSFLTFSTSFAMLKATKVSSLIDRTCSEHKESTFYVEQCAQN